MTKRILVVEDQRDLLGVVGDLLDGLGYAVAEAYNGQDEEATRPIKADLHLKATPVIEVSSFAMRRRGEGESIRLRQLRH